MDKKLKGLLEQYIDACELVKETEYDIERLKTKGGSSIITSVKGSVKDFPYTAANFRIEGVRYNPGAVSIENRLLKERITAAEKIKTEVQQYMNTLPPRMQRIVRYKFFEGMSWDEVAIKIGRGATKDSLRMELERFLT